MYPHTTQLQRVACFTASPSPSPLFKSKFSQLCFSAVVHFSTPKLIKPLRCFWKVNLELCVFVLILIQVLAVEFWTVSAARFQAICLLEVFNRVAVAPAISPLYQHPPHTSLSLSFPNTRFARSWLCTFELAVSLYFLLYLSLWHERIPSIHNILPTEWQMNLYLILRSERRFCWPIWCNSPPRLTFR